MFLALDKDMNGTLSKQELKEYADGTLTEIFIERGRIQLYYLFFKVFQDFLCLILMQSCCFKSFPLKQKWN